jgi:hypothetical protein
MGTVAAQFLFWEYSDGFKEAGEPLNDLAIPELISVDINTVVIEKFV